MTPSPAEKKHAKARALLDTGQQQEALKLYQELCKQNPQDIQAWHLAGAIAGMLGKHDLARNCCEQVIRLNPAIPGAHLNLAQVLSVNGDEQQALVHFRAALKLQPNDAPTLTGLANLLIKRGQSEQAIEHLESAIHSDSRHTEAYNSLGNAYRELSMPDKATSCFRRALGIHPGYVDALCNLGAVLSDQLEFDQAEKCYVEALRLAPGHHFALRNLGNLYQSTGKFDQARRCYHQAIASNCADISVLSSLAELDERCGKQEDALACLEPLIRSGTYNAQAALTYAKLCRKNGNSGKGIQVMENLLDKTLSNSDRIDCLFQLGELHDRSGDYARAFQYFQQGNRLDAQASSSTGEIARCRAIIEHFNAPRMSALPRSRVHSELPVFIVGMPRTGTSLVEQILASHSGVAAGGEREDISDIIQSLSGESAHPTAYPECLKSVSAAQLTAVAEKHLKQITTLAAGKARFTDKMPLNGLHLGFIDCLLPGSRIIVCHRDPLDTCLSIYFNRFNAFHGYASDLSRLGTFYRHYYRVIEHWDRVLDRTLFHVHYENLVRDTEGVTRQLLEFCSLEWEPGCLQFHRNQRTVNTPSYDQVRRPIYASSIQRWKQYEQYIAPLQQALAKSK